MYFSDPVISFPGLGIDGLDPPRTLPFSVFGKEIYLYGVVIAIGFLLAILYIRTRCKDLGVTFDSVIDAILFAVPIAIVCARIYYVAFQWEYYKQNPISVFYIWEGGIAIYGGVIGAILGLALFSKVKKQPILPYMDIAGMGLLIGQLIGRWGNFFNREAHGAEITDNFFLRMGFTDTNGVTRYWHPTFLYESVWNLIGIVLIHFLSKKRKYDGQIFLWYVAWYGLGRLWIEGLRTDSLYIGNTGIRVSQLLAGVSCLAALAILLYIRFVKKPDGSKMLVNRGTAVPDFPAGEASDAEASSSGEAEGIQSETAASDESDGTSDGS